MSLQTLVDGHDIRRRGGIGEVLFSDVSAHGLFSSRPPFRPPDDEGSVSAVLDINNI